MSRFLLCFGLEKLGVYLFELRLDWEWDELDCLNLVVIWLFGD